MCDVNGHDTMAGEKLLIKCYVVVNHKQTNTTVLMLRSD